MQPPTDRKELQNDIITKKAIFQCGTSEGLFELLEKQEIPARLRPPCYVRIFSRKRHSDHQWERVQNNLLSMCVLIKKR